MKTKSKTDKEGLLRKQIAAQLPKATELAQVAALLSRNEGGQDWPTLAQNALAIWGACRDELAKCVERNLPAESDGEPQTKIVAPPNAPSFPILFANFLRLVFPKAKTEGERETLYREYLKDNIPVFRAMARSDESGTPNPDQAAIDAETPATMDEIEKAIARIKKSGITQNRYAAMFVALDNWKSNRRSESNSKNAKKRWSKKKGR